MERINITIIFADKRVKKNYEKLKEGEDSKREKYNYITQALNNIKKNPY